MPLTATDYFKTRGILAPSLADIEAYGRYRERQVPRTHPLKIVHRPAVILRQSYDELCRVGEARSLLDLIDFVASLYRIAPEDMQIKTNKRDIVEPRQVCMTFAHKKLGIPIARVGFELAGRDHTTVLHAVRCVVNFYNSNRDFRNRIRRVLEWYQMSEEEFKQMIEWNRYSG